MINAEVIANHCEAAIKTRLQGFTDGKTVDFTPSIVEGRRYIGFKKDGEEYLIEVNVTNASSPQEESWTKAE